MGVETISEFEKCEFMNLLEFIRRTEIHITILVDKITTMLTGPTLTWENFISHGLRLFKTTLKVAEAQVGQATERGDYRIRRIKMKGLLGESLSRDVLADCPFHVTTIQSARGALENGSSLQE